MPFSDDKITAMMKACGLTDTAGDPLTCYPFDRQLLDRALDQGYLDPPPGSGEQVWTLWEHHCLEAEIPHITIGAMRGRRGDAAIRWAVSSYNQPNTPNFTVDQLVAIHGEFRRARAASTGRASQRTLLPWLVHFTGLDLEPARQLAAFIAGLGREAQPQPSEPISILDIFRRPSPN